MLTKIVDVNVPKVLKHQLAMQEKLTKFFQEVLEKGKQIEL